MKKISALILILIALIAFSGCETTSHVEKENISLNIPAAAPAAPAPIFIKPSMEWPIIIPTPLRPITPGGCLDYVDNKSAMKPVTVSDKSKVKFAGWAAYVERGIVPQSAYLEFEGPVQAYLKITIRVNRPDVAAYFDKPGLMDSGWEAYADLTALPGGDYKVKIIQIEGRSGLVYDTSRYFKINETKS